MNTPLKISVIGAGFGALSSVRELASAARRGDLCAVVSVSAFAHPEHFVRRWLATRHVPCWPQILMFLQPTPEKS